MQYADLLIGLQAFEFHLGKEDIMEENVQNTNGNNTHARHSISGNSQNASSKRRNSSIELLRIIAMFMILMHHFSVHNNYAIHRLPWGLERVFLQLVMAGGGKVGVVIFFSISAWFFLDKEQTIKSNLKRVWVLERELLFWSLMLSALYLIFDRKDIGIKLVMKSFMPLTMELWWYATAYAIFLALLPFLSKGLKALGREYHLMLAIVVLVIWGLTSFVPESLNGLAHVSSSLTGVFGFVYLFILISAYKWYMKPFTLKQIWLMTGIGLGFFLLYTGISVTVFSFGYDLDVFIIGDWTLPVIMIGFGLFLLFDRVIFYSNIINRVAQSAFSVYLITDFDASKVLLWVRLLRLDAFYHQPFAILRILGVLLVVYVACTLFDFIRQALFALTIDRHRGRWFDLVWRKVERCCVSR